MQRFLPGARWMSNLPPYERHDYRGIVGDEQAREVWHRLLKAQAEWDEEFECWKRVPGRDDVASEQLALIPNTKNCVTETQIQEGLFDGKNRDGPIP